jgi:hypothetical protein
MNLKNISNFTDPTGEIPENYEQLPKCLIKFIDIGTTIKVEKDNMIYKGGRFCGIVDNNVIIKNYNNYLSADINEYNIYIYNVDKRQSRKQVKRVLKLKIF